METPAIRLTRKSSELLKEKQDPNTSNSKPGFSKQKTLLNFFGKKNDCPDLSPTPKKKQKLSSSLKNSREATPKKTAPVVKEHEEEEKVDKLPRNQKQLDKLLGKVKQKISFYKNVFFQEQRELKG